MLIWRVNLEHILWESDAICRHFHGDAPWCKCLIDAVTGGGRPPYETYFRLTRTGFFARAAACAT